MTEIVIKTLSKGTRVKIEGIPVELTENTQVSSSVGNWSIIDRYESIAAISETAEPDVKGEMTRLPLSEESKAAGVKWMMADGCKTEEEARRLEKAFLNDIDENREAVAKVNDIGKAIPEVGKFYLLDKQNDVKENVLFFFDVTKDKNYENMYIGSFVMATVLLEFCAKTYDK